MGKSSLAELEFGNTVERKHHFIYHSTIIKALALMPLLICYEAAFFHG
jgi:hypothetical protein